MRHKNFPGFTLVEVMIVVAIIALLAAIAIPNLIRARVTANDSAAKASLKAISTSMESYYAVNNSYPPDTTALLSSGAPYLNVDYFTGTHNGFTFNTDILTNYTYQVTAAPQSANLGTSTFTISTGSVVSWR